MRILIAEDNLTSRKALIELLRADGHDPVGVESGHEAVAAWAEMHPDLLILDYHLPDMTGLEVIAHIEAVDGASAPPALLVTAQGLGRRARAAAAGLQVRVFRKPVQPQEFLAAVSSVRGEGGLA